MKIKIKEKKQIANPKELAEILQEILNKENKIDQEKEHLWAIGLNARNIIQYIELVSLGILNANLVHPREVFKLAILKGVASIFVIHNHPSGDTQPSEDDLEITQQLKKAGDLLGIEVIDHIIITKTGFLSFKTNLGLMNSKIKYKFIL
jgi:DNA repair protein RadC